MFSVFSKIGKFIFALKPNKTLRKKHFFWRCSWTTGHVITVFSLETLEKPSHFLINSSCLISCLTPKQKTHCCHDFLTAMGGAVFSASQLHQMSSLTTDATMELGDHDLEPPNCESRQIRSLHKLINSHEKLPNTGIVFGGLWLVLGGRLFHWLSGSDDGVLGHLWVHLGLLVES